MRREVRATANRLANFDDANLRRSARAAVVDGQPAALAPLLADARAIMTSDDAREGLQSFIERREARFTGR